MKKKILTFIKIVLDFMKKHKFTIIFLLFLFLSTYYIFMKFNVLISYDGTNYYSYLDIFKGNKPINTWNIERGFSFPLFIYLSTLLFGNTAKGYLTGVYILFFLMLLTIFYFINKLVKTGKIKNKKWQYYVLFVLLIPFNPIIFGWSHYMLTEAIIVPLYFLGLLNCYKWFELDFKENKIKYILNVVLMACLSIIIWFVKQPYAPCFWAMIIITGILKSINKKQWKNLFENIIIFVIVLLTTFISILCWNKIISKNNNTVKNGRNNSFYFQRNLFEGVYYHIKPVEKERYCSKKYIDNMKLSDKRKENIYNIIEKEPNWCDILYVYEVTDNNFNLYKHEYIITYSGFPNTKESLMFVAKAWIRYPLIQMDTVVDSYLSLIDLHDTSSLYKATGNFNGDANKEMKDAFYSLSYNNDNTWWVLNKENEEYKNYFTKSINEVIRKLKKFEGKTSKSSFWSNMLILFEDTAMLSFKLLLLFCLPIGIYSLIKYISNPKSKLYLLSTIICFSSFIHMIFHIFMGAIIDRYAYPIYPLMLFCLIILFIQSNNRDKINEKRK